MAASFTCLAMGTTWEMAGTSTHLMSEFYFWGLVVPHGIVHGLPLPYFIYPGIWHLTVAAGSSPFLWETGEFPSQDLPLLQFLSPHESAQSLLPTMYVSLPSKTVLPLSLQGSPFNFIYLFIFDTGFYYVALAGPELIRPR